MTTALIDLAKRLLDTFEATPEDQKPSLWERWRAASEYVDAINDLPPTYNIGEELSFTQMVPDPVSDAVIGMKLQRVKDAEANWARICDRVNCH